MTIYRDGHIVPPTSRKVLRMKATAVRKRIWNPIEGSVPDCALSGMHIV